MHYKNKKNMADFLPDDVSERKLDFGYWYLLHKKRLRQIVVVTLILCNIGFGTFVLWGLLKHFVLEADQIKSISRELTEDLVEYSSYKVRNTPQELQFIGIDVLNVETGVYDIVAQVRNLNDKWAQEFEYAFSYGGGEQTDFKQGYILPGEVKFIYALGVKSSRVISQPRIITQNAQWTRILDYEHFGPARLKFDIPAQAVSHASARASGVSGQIPVEQTSFTVVNNSAFNYWNVGFFVVLYRGSSVAAVNYISTDNFVAGESRNLTLNWFQALPSIQKVDIIPEVNILDENVYMPLNGDLTPVEDVNFDR